MTIKPQNYNVVLRRVVVSQTASGLYVPEHASEGRAPRWTVEAVSDVYDRINEDNKKAVLADRFSSQLGVYVTADPIEAVNPPYSIGQVVILAANAKLVVADKDLVVVDEKFIVAVVE